MNRVILFINGELSEESRFYQEYITAEDRVVAADGGANHTFKLGIIPDLILGDLDSIKPEVLDYYQDKKVLFDKYPVAKNKTDTQLILEQLLTEGYEEIVIFAALGGRLDHTLANIYLLEGLAVAQTKIKLLTPKQSVELITAAKTTIIEGKGNKIISLLPLTDKVTGVYLTGFRYSLADGVFYRGDTLGLSNVVEKKGEIKIKSGKLLLIINN